MIVGTRRERGSVVFGWRWEGGKARGHACSHLLTIGPDVLAELWRAHVHVAHGDVWFGPAALAHQPSEIAGDGVGPRRPRVAKDVRVNPRDRFALGDRFIERLRLLARLAAFVGAEARAAGAMHQLGD